VVIQIARLSDGTRKIITISEVVGMEGDVITMQDIFLFERTGVSEDGVVIGRFRPTGIRPKFADRLLVAGIKLPQDLFEDVPHVRPREHRPFAPPHKVPSPPAPRPPAPAAPIAGRTA